MCHLVPTFAIEWDVEARTLTCNSGIHIGQKGNDDTKVHSGMRSQPDDVNWPLTASKDALDESVPALVF
jgi:hypothetical protein